MFSVDPIPNCPAWFLPQQADSAVSKMMQVWALPVLIWVTTPVPMSTVGRKSPISGASSPVLPAVIPRPVRPYRL